MAFKSNWQKAYDQQAPPEALEGGIRQFNGYHNPRLYALLQKSLHRATLNWQNWRILDAGCGSGDTNSFLKAKNQVVGADFSWQMARHARRHYEQLSLADVEKMPFQSAAFQGVIATGLWQCLAPNTPFLGEVARLLQPQGEAVFGWVLNADFLPYRRGLRSRLDAEVSLSLLSAAQIPALLLAAGLEVLHIDAAIYPLGMLKSGHPFLRPFAPAYTVKCRKLNQ